MSVSENPKSNTDPRAEFVEGVRNALSKGLFVRLTLGKGRAEDGCERAVGEILEGGRVRVVYSYPRKEETKVFEAGRFIQECRSVIGTSFFCATLHATDCDLALDYSRKGVPRLDRRKATYSTSATISHNREKKRFIDTDLEFLKELGISDAQGRVRPEKYDKYRQIDKFLEIVDSLYRDSSLTGADRLSLVDIGSGKSYLTFALYEYFSRIRGKAPVVRGIEIRDDMVMLSNEVAGRCGYTGLTFEKGSVGSVAVRDADIVVALHACDTATDEALAYAIREKASIVVCAPCCHKYVRKQMAVPRSLEPILRHGILEERFAESLTDGLRSLTLESHGYRSKVFEFISLEHTAKNTMVTGVRGGGALERAEREIEQLRVEFGLKDYCLDRLLVEAEG